MPISTQRVLDGGESAHPTHLQPRPPRCTRSSNFNCAGVEESKLEELEAAIVYMASAASDYVNSHALMLDDGFLSW